MITELQTMLETFWGFTVAWVLGTYTVVKFVRNMTLKFESSDDLSVQGRNVLKSELRKLHDNKSRHWVNDFGLVVDKIYGRKMISLRAFSVNALISTFLYFSFTLLSIGGLEFKNVSQLGSYYNVGNYFIFFVFPFVNVIFDFLSLLLTRFVLRLRDVKYYIKVFLDFLLSFLLIILGVFLFLFAISRAPVYLPFIVEYFEELAEEIYQADIVRVNEYGMNYVTYKKDTFEYEITLEDGRVVASSIKLMGDDLSREEFNERLAEAEDALELAIIGIYDFAINIERNPFLWVSITNVLATSLSTSVWLWLHGFSTLTIFLLRKVSRNFRLLNVEGKPIQLVGIVTCAYIISFSIFIYLYTVVFLR